MAVSISSTAAKTGRVGDNIDGDSDYGSDFSVGEEQLVNQILADLAPDNTATGTVRHSSTRGYNGGRSDAPSPASAWDATLFTRGSTLALAQSADDDKFASAVHLEQYTVPLDPVEYPDLSHALSNLDSEIQPAQESPRSAIAEKPDTRTPLQRFRSFPRRPLTVTDLAAGAWCELQHWYTLTRLPGGKRTITPAMRGGTRVHQKLEDEVHTTVQVSIASKEEAFALRLWNVIQGLRTLRDTGKTRELEVWGTVEGEIFNGVIDQLSHESPNASFEEELDLASSNVSSQQSSITDYLGPNHKKVYITDVKTRGSGRLPSGPALRPARVQLFLYHRLLSDMATDKLDYNAIFERYGLNGEARFSDAFIAQVGGLHDEIFYDADSEVEDAGPGIELPDLIGYRSISQMIPLVKVELKETFPRGSASIGDLLSVEYRHRDTERIIGNNSFSNDPEVLDEFMKDNLRWWRGEREPNGVCIEETYKCRWCEFAESCQWRKDKEIEFLNNRRRSRPNASHA
ncbi:exonuclease V [Xylaria flabelliformis]|nr:exonuclease V [Xylaria flabelliformis]